MDVSVEGHCDEKFLPLREAFIRNFTDDQELGAAFALSLGGEMVVNLWGGYDSPERTALWQEGTVVQVSSSSKIVCSLCGLLLIDRGLIALDEPIATYWPEFAANGKAKLPVRYIFCHATGLAGLDGMPGWDILGDFDEVTRRLAAQKPWWEPGTRSGYHGFTYGHLIGELVRRTTGKTIGQFFRDEIGDPLDIDFFFGLTDTHAGRLAEVEQPEQESPVDGVNIEALRKSMWYRAMGYIQTDSKVDKTLDDGGMLSQDVPAANGVTNARALAKVGSLLATGGMSANGRILSEETAALPYEEQLYSLDLVFGDRVRYGVGFGISSDELGFPWPNTFHWGGFGGSNVIMVPELRAAFAYTPSKFFQGRGVMDHRGEKMRNAAIKCLQAVERTL